MPASWSAPTFFGQLRRDWLSDLENFLHVGLPKLIVILLGSWLLILAVDFITKRIVRVAERASALTVRASQVRTLATVVRASGIAIVFFIAALQVMENVLNLNLAPLLASAGVAGVAIGLAAQTIVKDVLNGFLILMEDQYSVGEVVTLAGVTGTVYSMTLRHTRVLGFDGTLYIIPNSQIATVSNQNREFSVTTLNISVDFSASPDDVVPLLNQIATSVRNDPAYKKIFLEDPKVLGVDSIKGSEVIYPIVVKTLARQQFDAVREIQRRIRLGLEERHMLPGSPYRVANHPADQAAQAGAPEASPPAPDPTTIKPEETNPFAG